MDNNTLRALAEVGARIRLEQLTIERAQILRAFPRIDSLDAPPNANGPGRARGPRGPRQRPPMTPAQRAAISRRMKNYWATKRG
jgi:hypothetical protein